MTISLYTHVLWSLIIIIIIGGLKLVIASISGRVEFSGKIDELPLCNTIIDFDHK